MGDLPQLVGAALGILRPQCQAKDGHVVDALRLHERLQHAEAGRAPVLVRVDRVVEADDGVGAVLPDLELHRHHGCARARHRIDVLHAGDLGKHFLHGRRDEVLDLLRARSGERHDDVGHRDVDLRLFLARRDEHGEQPEQQRGQPEQRRELAVEEQPGDPPAEAELLSHASRPAGRPGPRRPPDPARWCRRR